MIDTSVTFLTKFNHTFRRGGNSEVASLKQIHYQPITSYIHSLVGFVMINEIWYGRAGATMLVENRNFDLYFSSPFRKNQRNNSLSWRHHFSK